MSETAFPINDLLRRKLQTTLTITSLTLCVASTLFLLLFSQRIGFGIMSTVEDKLTYGFSIVYRQFTMFVTALIFVVGAIIISFIVFAMMSQRTRDIGLIKAAGCPNDLIFGYFMTELLVITFTGCLLGVILGLIADFVFSNLLNSFQISRGLPDFWLTLLVFASFFVLSIIFGAKPILDTAKIEPAKAMSSIYYFRTEKSIGFKVMSKSALTLKIALRSLFRRKSATIQIVLCLITVFILVTVAVGGSIIADQTTENWAENAVGRDLVLIGHRTMCDHYDLLLSKFHGAKENSKFDYSDERFLIPEDILHQLRSIPGITHLDPRLVLEAHVEEIRNYTFDPETGATIPIGDNRKGESLIVGIEPNQVLAKWFLQGQLLSEEQAWDAVIGDSLGQEMFSAPLSQGIRLQGKDFNIKGVCLDPINNGNVTYVPLQTLQNITGVSKPNIVIVKIDPSANRTETISQIREKIESVNSNFAVLDLNEVLDKNLNFLSYLWSTIMFLPFFSLLSTSLCLIGYVVLTITEQRQELGILRAVGAKPKTIVHIVSTQTFVVLLSSYAAGTALGIIFTLMILVPNPLVTGYAIIEIVGWLLAALTATFILSLYPAIKFAKKPILQIITQVN